MTAIRSNGLKAEVEDYGRLANTFHALGQEMRHGSIVIKIDHVRWVLNELREGKRLVSGGDYPVWIQVLVDQEKGYHGRFFKRQFNLCSFAETLNEYGKEQINSWWTLGLEPHFLPQIVMSNLVGFPGWKKKPNDWYYEQVKRGKVMRMVNGRLKPDKKAYELSGIAVLIDTRLKPAFKDGKQMYKDDNLLGVIIRKLRQDAQIANYDNGPASSRFNISANEWERHLKPVLAKKLGLKPIQVRLERAIEANIIPQLYLHMPRQDDNTTNTWVWYEEYFKSHVRRLRGGRSDCAGLTFVDFDWSGVPRNDGSVRPLIVLS